MAHSHRVAIFATKYHAASRWSSTQRMALQVKNLKRRSAAQKDAVAQRVAQRLWIGRDFFFLCQPKP
jgi:hypothetical protein